MEGIRSKPLWKDKTYIISTRSFKMLEYADRVIYMEKGKITFFGKLADLKKRPEFKEYMQEQQKKEQNDDLMVIVIHFYSIFS